MNQEVRFKFSIIKDNRLYQFTVMPGSPWTDIEAVLDEMKAEFIALKEQAQAVTPPDKKQEVWE